MTNKLWKILLHSIMPNRCMLCDNPTEYNKNICSKCEKVAPFVSNEVCLVCGQSVCRCNNHFKQLISPFYYDMGIERAIQNIKFHDDFHTAKKLAKYMMDCLKNEVDLTTVDFIVYVPLYRKDFSDRGYNQSQKLAEYIAEGSNKPLYNDLLIKVKLTKKQHNLNQKQRRENLLGAFTVAQNHEIEGKTIVLVDDVYTTGSTMNICSEQLMAFGAKEVIALVGAKTRYDADKMGCRQM